MTQAEADEHQQRFAEVRRVSALWIESMHADLWQSSRDEVAAMLSDLSMPELAMVRIAIGKIKKDRTGEASL